MATKLTDPYSIPPDKRWSGPDITRNLREFKQAQAAARAANAPAPDPPDPLTAAHLRIAELEGQLKAMQRELDKSRNESPHLRGRELRKSTS